MDRKRARLSLSRKRKIGLTNGNVTNHESCILEKPSENIIISSEEISVESKENDFEAQDSPDVKKGKFSGSVRNNAKESIATWFKKPYNPKTVSCPMCEKLVILSKINLHLDNSCEGYLGQHSNSSSKHTHKVNELLGSNCNKDVKERVSEMSRDRTTKSNNGEINAKSPQKMDPSVHEVSSTSETSVIVLDPAVVPLLKTSNKMDRSDGSCGTSNQCCGIVCDNNAKQDSSSQSLHVCVKCVVETQEQILTHNDGISQAKQKNSPTDPLQSSTEELDKSLAREEILTLNNGILQTKQVNSSTVQSDTCSSTEELNKRPAEENLENSNDQENKDHEPYYLANFKLVLNNVLSNEDDRQLFNEPDNKFIDAFNGMSSEEQKLYIHLFQRKRGWFRCSKLEYPRISNNLTPILNSLVQKGTVNANDEGLESSEMSRCYSMYIVETASKVTFC